jgi:hypothetical protein
MLHAWRRPLVDEAVPELLNGVDVSAQAAAIRDLDVKQLVRMLSL